MPGPFALGRKSASLHSSDNLNPESACKLGAVPAIGMTRNFRIGDDSRSTQFPEPTALVLSRWDLSERSSSGNSALASHAERAASGVFRLKERRQIQREKNSQFLKLPVDDAVHVGSGAPFPPFWRCAFSYFSRTRPVTPTTKNVVKNQPAAICTHRNQCKNKGVIVALRFWAVQPTAGSGGA